MTCRRCAADPHPPWAAPNSPRRCAFPCGGEFSSDNWNCGTMNELRALVDGRRPVAWDEDESCAAVSVDIDHEDDSQWMHGFLVLQWYKSRGRTTGAVIMNATRGGYQPLTLELAEMIIREYEEKP